MMNLYKFHSNPESLHRYMDFVKSNPDLALNYAMESGKRFPEGEKAILRAPSFSYGYAKNVIKGRWPEFEKALKDDPNVKNNVGADSWGLTYAIEIAKQRVPGLEEILLQRKDTMKMIRYAKEVVKGRWPEAEKMILELGSGADPREPAFRKVTAYQHGVAYARDVIKGRWPEFEKLLKELPDQLTNLLQPSRLKYQEAMKQLGKDVPFK